MRTAQNCGQRRIDWDYDQSLRRIGVHYHGESTLGKKVRGWTKTTNTVKVKSLRTVLGSSKIYGLIEGKICTKLWLCTHKWRGFPAHGPFDQFHEKKRKLKAERWTTLLGTEARIVVDIDRWETWERVNSTIGSSILLEPLVRVWLCMTDHRTNPDLGSSTHLGIWIYTANLVD